MSGFGFLLLSAALSGQALPWDGQPVCTLVVRDAGYDPDLYAHRPVNRLIIARRGPMLWNGAAIDPDRLETYVGATVAFDPQPLLVVRAERGAAVPMLFIVRHIISRQLGCRVERF